jgi:hypothetical protein
MNASENRVKFTANQIEVPEEYELGANILFKGEAEIAQKLQKDNSDGTYTQIHLLRPKLVELVTSEGIFKEPVTAVPTKNTPSQRLRTALYVYWDQQMKFKYPNFQVYYESYIDKQIDKIKQELV